MLQSETPISIGRNSEFKLIATNSFNLSNEVIKHRQQEEGFSL